MRGKLLLTQFTREVDTNLHNLYVQYKVTNQIDIYYAR